MKFGLFFPHQLPRPWTDASEQQLFADALDIVELADRLGISHAWAQEHHFLEEYSHSTAPEVFLGAASQRTKNIRLGHGISVMPPGVNHPARVAERIATLDLVSGGRVEWGTGEMTSRIELEGFGLDYVQKRAMWAEAVREVAIMMSTTPYPGFEGKFFSMPTRNIVPKPVQKPHPPLWVACTNRETMKMAAKMGLGALTFAFMGPDEARYWVEEYYEIFRTRCQPIGRAVNPNIATLIGFGCDNDSQRAREIATDHQRFFKYGLAHYYRFGKHVPGDSQLWRDFEAAEQEPMAGLDGVGSPDELKDNFRAYEEIGLDQLILLQQAGRMETSVIVDSLNLFGTEVLPEFIERDRIQSEKKAQELAPYIEKALNTIEPIPKANSEPVEAYPSLWSEAAGKQEEIRAQRSVYSSALWSLHVSGRK